VQLISEFIFVIRMRCMCCIWCTLYPILTCATRFCDFVRNTTSLIYMIVSNASVPVVNYTRFGKR